MKEGKKTFKLWLQSVSLRRAVGLYIDGVMLICLCFLPLIVHILVDKHTFEEGPFNATVTAYGGGILMYLFVFTPVPLVTLRLVKTLMRMPTPGEFLCGYASVSRRSLIDALFDQAAFGFLQYVLLFLSVCTNLFLVVFVCWMLDSFPSIKPVVLDNWLFGVFNLVLLNIGFICVLDLFFSTSVEASGSSGFDRLCKLEVLPLRNKQHTELEESKSASLKSE